MKRIGNLYEIVCDESTIRQAIYEASRGKRRRREVQKVLANMDEYAGKIRRMLVNETFKPSPYSRETIRDGSRNKERDILKPRFYPDQIIHWCIYLAIREPFYRGMYVFSCGSIPERGVHYGKRYVKKWITQDKKNTKYYLKMDIRKFYPSVKPWRLLEKLKRKIKDQKLLRLLALILSMSDGLPIGILLSMILANFFMNEVDFYIKQELGAIHYIRYADDMVIFDCNKKRLHRMRRKVEERLAMEGLVLKGNWCVSRFDKEPLDFMGFRFYRDHITLRKSIMLRISRKVRKVWKKGNAVTFKDACSVLSRLGWVKHTNSYGFFIKWIRPYISIVRMKNIVRRMQLETLCKRKYRQAVGMG